jgi:hypothetical protein
VVNVSAPIKIFALVALLAALVLGGGMMLLAPGETEVEAEPVLVPSTRQAESLATPPVAKAAAKSKPEPKPVVTPKPAPAVAPNGLPTTIARALRSHDVVVVSLWSGGGTIDGLAREEAAAGARAARAGFVPLNVIASGRAAEALTLEVGSVLRAPAVLLFTRPDTLAYKLDGFRDRDAVAQAVFNALR